MAKIRVLVVDDSAVMRRLLTGVMAEDPELEVVATAPHGRAALDLLEQANPDVVTLDLEMPVMDGLATLRELRRLRPRLPVIMFSMATDRGAAVTLEALALGASDYVTKPSRATSPAEGMAQVRAQLIPKLKGLARRAHAGVTAPGAAAVRPRPAAAPTPAGRPQVVAIGVSTGGPLALGELLPALGADLAAPVLIVQHMPPLFTRALAERLSAASRLQVREATADCAIEPGCAYVAPGDFHLTVQRAGADLRAQLTQTPPEHFCRPAVDVLFRSVAQVFGAGVLGLVLTGMGQDGLAGARVIKEAGGSVLVQDEPSSVVWGMPGAVAQAGLADGVMTLSELAAAVVERVGRRSAGARPAAGGPSARAGVRQ